MPTIKDHDGAIAVDLIMLSSFNRSGGGRETWAYNFLPRLLASDKKLHLRIYGLKNYHEVDNSQEFVSVFANHDRERLSINIMRAYNYRVPRLFLAVIPLMMNLRRSHARTGSPNITLGVGSVAELILIMLSRRLRRRRKILWLRGIYLHEKAARIPSFLRVLARRLEVWGLSKANVLLANGDDIADHYRSLGLNVHVIKNGVDLEKWCMPAPALVSPLKVAFIGRLSKVKGIEEFFSAIKFVRAAGESHKFEFLVIGGGEYAEQAIALDRAGYLTYYGAVPNDQVAQYLHQVDICVALTFSSPALGGGGTSNALLEQMAAGKVIIAWDNPHFNQVLSTDNALLVQQGNIEQLVRALGRCFAERELLLSIASRAVGAAKEYSFENQLKRFKDVLYENYP